MTCSPRLLLAIACSLTMISLPRLDAAEPFVSLFGHSAPDGATEAETQPIPSTDEGDASESDAPKLKDVDERLRELEAAWAGYQDDLDAKAKKAASEPSYELGGRIHADYWAFPHTSPGIGYFEHPDAVLPNYGDDPADRFVFRRVRLELEGDIPESILWRIQVDFNRPEFPEIKDVYIGFDELPNNQTLIVGNQKRPLSLDALESSRDTVFLERPLIVDSFDEDYRRPGIVMYGNSDDESLGWAYGAYLLGNITLPGRYIGDVYQPSLNARLFGSPWYDESSGGRGYFHWGIAGMVAHPDGNPSPLDVFENETQFRTRPEARSSTRWLDTGRIAGAQYYEVLGLESLLNIGAFQIAGEFMTNWTQRDSANGDNLFFHGGYVYVAYMLTGEHIPYRRDVGIIGRLIPFENFFLVDRCSGGVGHGWGAWQLGLRYSYADLTDSDITGGIGHNGTLALNWFFSAYSKLQFNLIYGRIDERGPVAGFDSGDYLIAGTRLAIEF